MGLALLCIIWLITFLSSYYFVARPWWPHAISASAPYLDHQIHVTLIAMGVVFLAAQVALGLFAWRYRDRGSQSKATYSHGNTTLEAVWTVLTAVLFIGLNLVGSPIWAAERFHPPDPGSLQVEVTGISFAWYFRYPGPDGKYGRTNFKLQDPSIGGAG